MTRWAAGRPVRRRNTMRTALRSLALLLAALACALAALEPEEQPWRNGTRGVGGGDGGGRAPTAGTASPAGGGEGSPAPSPAPPSSAPPPPPAGPPEEGEDSNDLGSWAPTATSDARGAPRPPPTVRAPAGGPAAPAPTSSAPSPTTADAPSPSPEGSTPDSPGSSPAAAPPKEEEEEDAMAHSGTDFSCNCSSFGSTGLSDCNVTTEQCKCHEGYAGQLCDQCEAGYYPAQRRDGRCLACGCDPESSLSPSCNDSGICRCKEGAMGPKCAQCQEAFSRFNRTTCEPCRCNNHAKSCDPWTGTCLECDGNTEGPNCETCRDQFYRNNSSPHECLRCPCSPVVSTGSCRIKPGDSAPSCDKCQLGYVGPRCSQCAEGYYSSDSLCVRCWCNGNVDPARSPSVCQPETGECIGCLYHTAGLHCEKCREGYTRPSEGGNCTKEEAPLEPEHRGLTPPATNISLSASSSTAAINSTPSPTTVPTPFPAGSTDNSTSALADVSWTQFNIIILTVIIILVVLLMGFVGAVYVYREYQNRKLNAPFWTIELKEDNISFSSYHDSIPNADVSGLLEDDGNEVAPNGQLTLATPMHNFKV